MSGPNSNGSLPVTSGTFNFQPSMGEEVLFAFSLVGVMPTELVQHHFQNARMATNKMLLRWSAKGVNLWQVDLQCVNLVQGQSSYAVPSNTVVILDAYVGTTNGSQETDRLILPISRTEYASYANKQQIGVPTTYWFNRQLSPCIVLWPVSDGSYSVFKYYRLRQNMDANYTNGTGIEIPPYFGEAFSYGLAARLALIYAPARYAVLQPMADAAYADAADQNVETSQIYVAPMTNGYYR